MSVGEKTIDRTVISVKRQLQGMGADKYEVGILDSMGDMLIRRWSTSQVMGSIGWLKHRNLNDCDIYIRPDGSQGLILLDDVNVGTLSRLRDDGLVPACVVESSPLNFHAWIRLSLVPIDNDLATAVAQYLADCYDTDPNSADWRHFGRLGGFTNRKPEHVGDDGRFPYVLVHDCPGAIAPKAESIFDAVGEWRKKREEAEARSLGKRPQISTLPLNSDAVSYYRSELHGLIGKYGHELNESKADWMIANRMAERGYTRWMIAAAIEAISPDLQQRKRGHVADYIKLTVDNVFRRFEQPGE